MIRYATQKDENAIYELLCELEGMSLDKEADMEMHRIVVPDYAGSNPVGRPLQKGGRR